MSLKDLPNLSIETSGLCNRKCVTCLRNSHPKIPDGYWEKNSNLPVSVIFKILDEAVENGFTGKVCLSHYNEPLMDDGFTKIVEAAKKKHPQLHFYAHTNGDLLTEEIAKQLDGWLDRLVVTLYMDEPKKSERAQWVHTLFDKTIVDVIIRSAHIPTHYSPNFDVKALAKSRISNPCREPSMRIIVNHKGQYLFCCDDILNEFNLGSYYEKNLIEHWKQKMEMQNLLLKKGGRRKFEYCSTCPRP